MLSTHLWRAFLNNVFRASRKLQQLRFEQLEERVVPTTVTWINPGSGDWDVGAGDGVGQGTFTAAKYNSNGTYTATFTGTTAGSNTITAAIGGDTITSTAPTITVTPGPASAAKSLVSLSTNQHRRGRHHYGHTPGGGCLWQQGNQWRTEGRLRAGQEHRSAWHIQHRHGP